jgi:hypothetical protein
MNLPKRFILNKKPKSYLEQGKINCGTYVLKSIISTYKNKNYSPGIIKQLLLSLPIFIKKELERYGFKAKILRASNLNDTIKLSLIKKELKNSKPVILYVRSSYSRKGEEHKIRSYLVGHYISILGYDDNLKVFFIYDPLRSKEYQEKLPIGNVSRSYKKILEDWKDPIYGKFMNFLYIPISK